MYGGVRGVGEPRLLDFRAWSGVSSARICDIGASMQEKARSCLLYPGVFVKMNHIFSRAEP